MVHDDRTLSSPLATMSLQNQPLLCLSIVWHPDASRIGEQVIASDATLEVSRYLPIFHRPSQAEGLCLGHGGISREPLRLVRDADGVQIWPSNSRMVLELNGVATQATNMVSNAQVEAGVMLGLGRAVLLCLHFLRELPKPNPLPSVIGIGAAAQRLRDLILQVARSDSAVLLLGETGTGKEVAARAIHAQSTRASAPLLTVNMAALNESLAAAELFGAAKGAYTGAQQARTGLFAQAHEATLFLDEIGNAPSTIQPMLLRVLEGGDYRPLGSNVDLQTNARIIAATDQNLYSDGFNQALLRRLESFVIAIPPLRKRREDIGVLIQHLIQTSKIANADPQQLPFALVAQMALYDWPGNIRQLRHVVKRCLLAAQMGQMGQMEQQWDWQELCAESDVVQNQMLANAMPSTVSALSTPMSLPLSVPLSVPVNAPTNVPTNFSTHLSKTKPADLTPAQVLQAMANNQWQIMAAAQYLGIARQSMYTLLENHPQIRRAEYIDAAEIRLALQENGGDILASAAQLQTPSEGLRRYVRVLGLL